MTGLPITLTFTFDDMAKAEAFLADVRRSKESVAEGHGGGSRKAPHAVGRRTSAGSPQGEAEDAGVTAGETAPHSEMDGGAIAAVKGQARPASVVDAEPSPSSTILPLSKPLRPHCQNREVCAGVGLRHCYRCSKAAEAAQASEIAA